MPVERQMEMLSLCLSEIFKGETKVSVCRRCSKPGRVDEVHLMRSPGRVCRERRAEGRARGAEGHQHLRDTGSASVCKLSGGPFSSASRTSLRCSHFSPVPPPCPD